jgi:hypothetical protein
VDRIRLLENTLTEHGIPVPSPQPPQSSCVQQNPQENVPDLSGWSTLSLLNDPAEEGDDRERALIERIDQGNTLTPGLDPDIELLVKRTGSLQFTEHGQLRYFGTTSNVHFLRTAIPFQPQLYQDALGQTPNAWLEQAGVGHTIPREFEDHLIKLYFTWENPYFNVVDQNAFLNARRQAQFGLSSDSMVASCYSELLVNAM